MNYCLKSRTHGHLQMSHLRCSARPAQLQLPSGAACSWVFLSSGLSSLTVKHVLLSWDQVTIFFFLLQYVSGDYPSALWNTEMWAEGKGLCTPQLIPLVLSAVRSINNSDLIPPAAIHAHAIKIALVYMIDNVAWFLYHFYPFHLSWNNKETGLTWPLNC